MFRVNKIHDDYHKLDRDGKVILIRVYTEHNQLNAHMNRKLNLVPSSICTCNIEDQNGAYTTETYESYYYIRNQLWSDNTTLQQKLYGTLGELRRIVSFIQQSGLSV